MCKNIAIGLFVIDSYLWNVALFVLNICYKFIMSVTSFMLGMEQYHDMDAYEFMQVFTHLDNEFVLDGRHPVFLLRLC